MENPRLIKKRVRSIGNIGKITKALEMVAAAKVQRAQEKALRSKPYGKKIYELTQSFAGKADPGSVPLLKLPDKIDNQLYILVSSNRGLAGSLNTNLLRNLATFLKTQVTKKYYFINLGKKSRNFSLNNGELLADYSDVLTWSTTIVSIVGLVCDKFIKSEVDEVYLVYSDFRSALLQEPQIKRLLPLQKAEIGEEKSEVFNLKDSVAHQKKPEVPEGVYNFEPSAESVLESILPYYLETEILEVLYEAEASEHSARMVAMKNASDNASDLTGSLSLEYIKARQSAITTEINDIVTAGMSLGA